LRLEFNAVGLVPEETYVSFAEANIAAGYPVIRKAAPHDVPLAIVGGGPSAGRALDALREWPGHIWAINQGATWLIAQGVTAPVWLFSVDPGVELAQWVAGVDRALLGTSCHPELFNALAGKDVAMFHTREVKGLRMVEDKDVKNPPKAPMFGPSGVCRVFMPAALLGYKDITFFGCEGSIEEKTHAYRDESGERTRRMIIRAGEREYVTTPDYYMTTRFLANVLREYPKLKERSGGLLRGMLEHWDSWEVVAISTALREQIGAPQGAPYQPRAA
jgi:hypothetical protein